MLTAAFTAAVAIAAADATPELVIRSVKLFERVVVVVVAVLVAAEEDERVVLDVSTSLLSIVDAYNEVECEPLDFLLTDSGLTNAEDVSTLYIVIIKTTVVDTMKKVDCRCCWRWCD
jgi:hypothetical protein